jgi:Tol biopolymer transport system component
VKRLIPAILVLALLSAAIAASPASATFRGRNGRIAWALWNAGGGGGGGYASLGTYNGRGRAGRSLGYCPEDDSGNVCTNWYDVTYSPDGTQLLWDQPDTSGKRVIVLAGADASHPTVIDHDAADDSQASFSANGRRIVYIRQPVGMGGGAGTIVTSNLSGGGVDVVSSSLHALAPEFTLDGKRILFVREGAFSLWSIGTDGHGLHRLLRHPSAFDLSPDGHHIVYVNQPGDLVVANADGSHSRRLARRPGGDSITAVRYSPDGKLIVLAGESMGNALFTVGAGGGTPRLIVNNGDGRTNTSGLSWQPLP